jgi:type VI secretion system protein ImpM
MNDAVTGFFGKLPSHGDFVTRRLPLEVVDIWTHWIDGGLSASRAVLGDSWLPIYLSSPIWRFALSAGLAGPAALCGIMFPSVDRVGRHYPFTVLTRLATDAGPASALFAAVNWFEEAEGLALSGLEEGFDFDSFDSAVALLAAPAVPPPAIAVGSGLEAPQQDVAGLLDRVAARNWSCHSLWSTTGSLEVDACIRLYPGLPEAADFASLLRWQGCMNGLGKGHD